MIIESQDELNAMEFVCELASAYTDRICNDLNPKEEEMFKHLTVPGTDSDGSVLENKVQMDYSVIYWLQLQIKKNDTLHAISEPKVKG